MFTQQSRSKQDIQNMRTQQQNIYITKCFSLNSGTICGNAITYHLNLDLNQIAHQVIRYFLLEEKKNEHGVHSKKKETVTHTNEVMQNKYAQETENYKLRFYKFTNIYTLTKWNGYMIRTHGTNRLIRLVCACTNFICSFEL